MIDQVKTSCQICKTLQTTQATMAMMTPCSTEDKNGKKQFTCLVCQWYYGCDGETCKPRDFGTGVIVSEGACVHPNPETNRYVPPCRSRGLFKESKLSEKRIDHFHSKWHAVAVEAARKHEPVKQAAALQWWPMKYAACRLKWPMLPSRSAAS